MAIKTIVPKLPRVGVIRLGTKAVSQKGFEYPVNAEHFIFPKEGEDGHDLIAGRFDDETAVLRVSFPVNDLDIVLSDFYRRYTASGLQCKGDGEQGNEAVFEDRTDARGKAYKQRGLVERECASLGCPYAMSGDCKPSGILSFSIEGIPALGVWHMTTHSISAIQEFKAVLQLALMHFGRVTNLPFELYRKPITVNPDGRQKTVWTVGLRLAASLSQNQLAAGAPVAMIDGRTVDTGTGEVLSDPPAPKIPDDGGSVDLSFASREETAAALMARFTDLGRKVDGANSKDVNAGRKSWLMAILGVDTTRAMDKAKLMILHRALDSELQAADLQLHVSKAMAERLDAEAAAAAVPA